MKMTGLFKVAIAQKGWISPPEKGDDIPWISFEVESAVLKNTTTVRIGVLSFERRLRKLHVLDFIMQKFILLLSICMS